ncbi:MAG: hypothetical protein U0133_10925 [Gemmatimonadales bacterium]
MAQFLHYFQKYDPAPLSSDDITRAFSINRRCARADDAGARDAGLDDADLYPALHGPRSPPAAAGRRRPALQPLARAIAGTGTRHQCRLAN